MRQLPHLFQTIPIPQNRADAKCLIQKAHIQCKGASNKLKLANAKLAEALVTAKLYRSRAIRAKQTLDAANSYLSHVRWTLERSKHRNVMWRPPRVITVTDGQRGAQGMGTVYNNNISDGSWCS